MSTSSDHAYPQDDLSGVLPTPPDSAHLAALHPEPLPVVVVAAPEAPAASPAPVPSGSPEPAGRVLQVVAGVAVLGCAAAGLFAWLG